MSCILSNGYTLGCRDNVGGVEEVYIGTWNGTLLGYTIGTNSTITAFTGSTVSFYKFEQEIETASFTQKSVPSIENGTLYYEQTLSITLHKLDAALRNQILILDRGKWRIIIKDRRGNYWLMGKVNPVRTTESNPGLGKAFGDLNGATITFSTKELEPAPIVDESAVLSVIA